MQHPDQLFYLEKGLLDPNLQNELAEEVEEQRDHVAEPNCSQSKLMRLRVGGGRAASQQFQRR